MANEFCNRLKKLREKAGLTQEGLEKASGLPATLISQYEKGSRAPGLANVKALISGLRCSADELISSPKPATGDALMSDLERYGLQWNGPKNFMATPMVDGYWTPGHIAAEDIALLNSGNAALQRRVDELEALLHDVNDESFHLRLQAEALDAFVKWAIDHCSGWAQDEQGNTYWHDKQILAYAKRLREAADETEKLHDA